MRIEIDKDWCMAAAKREDGCEVGVGIGPIAELRIKLTSSQKEVERLTAENERLERDLETERMRNNAYGKEGPQTLG